MTLDGNNLTFAGEGSVRTDFFGLTGHQLFGAIFSNRKFHVDRSERALYFRKRRIRGEEGLLEHPLQLRSVLLRAEKRHR